MVGEKNLPGVRQSGHRRMRTSYQDARLLPTQERSLSSSYLQPGQLRPRCLFSVQVYPLHGADRLDLGPCWVYPTECPFSEHSLPLGLNDTVTYSTSFSLDL